jgi:hypothetical protein
LNIPHNTDDLKYRVGYFFRSSREKPNANVLPDRVFVSEIPANKHLIDTAYFRLFATSFCEKDRMLKNRTPIVPKYPSSHASTIPLHCSK